MLRLLAGLGLVATVLMLSGCYLGPDYGYVRQTDYQGAYYGQARTYDGGYYPGPGYAPYYGAGYGGYGYGCCYAPGVSVGVGAIWYDRPRHRRYEQPRYRRYDGGGPRHQGDWRSGPNRGASRSDRSGPPRWTSRPDRGGSPRGTSRPDRSGPTRGAVGPGSTRANRAAGRQQQWRNP